MKIEVSSLFNQDEWKPVDLETFKRLACPVDGNKLGEMLNALEAGQFVMSVFKTLKFRKAVEDVAVGVMIFKFHTRYTFEQIVQIAAPQKPTRPGLISGLPNHVSVLGPDYEQYDFCGVDENNLVLVWIDGPE